MIYAGHFPTMRFTLAEFEAMPIVVLGSQYFPPDGFSRRLDSAGKALVVYYPPDWTTLEKDGCVSGSFAVRPIIVVPSRQRSPQERMSA